MRLRLTLVPRLRNCSITLSYNYYLSSAIYKWIETSSPQHSKFLHDRGFSIEGTSKSFKHFCFSQLMVNDRKIQAGRLYILSPQITWYVSMPVEVSLRHLVLGIFEKRSFHIEREENEFAVDHVEALPDVTWTRRMKFRMLSPLTVSVPEVRNGKLQPHYLRADDGRLSDAIRANILNKYKSLYEGEPVDSDFSCVLDERFIADRGGPERLSKLITIKEGLAAETKVRGFMCPLTIEGNPELTKLAYESGLGEKGSMGFGMLEIMHGASGERMPKSD